LGIKGTNFVLVCEGAQLKKRLRTTTLNESTTSNKQTYFLKKAASLGVTGLWTT